MMTGNRNADHVNILSRHLIWLCAADRDKTEEQNHGIIWHLDTAVPLRLRDKHHLCISQRAL